MVLRRINVAFLFLSSFFIVFFYRFLLSFLFFFLSFFFFFFFFFFLKIWRCFHIQCKTLFKTNNKIKGKILRFSCIKKKYNVISTYKSKRNQISLKSYIDRKNKMHNLKKKTGHDHTLKKKIYLNKLNAFI